MKNKTILDVEELTNSLKKLAQQPNPLSTLEMDSIFQRLALMLVSQNINKNSLENGATFVLGLPGSNKRFLLNHLIVSTDIDQNGSENNYPLVYQDNLNNTVFVDTSDASETTSKNIGSELLTSYLNDKIATYCPKFKILVVASINSLTDRNGEAFVTYLASLPQNIKNLPLITNSISLVFTKEDEVIKQQDIIERLNQLSVTEKKALGPEGHLILKDIIDTNRIRLFEQPDIKSTSKLYDFLEAEKPSKNQIISLINETAFADNTEGAIFNLAVSKEGRSLITQLLKNNNVLEKILAKEVINLIKGAFQRALSNGEDIERFQKLQNSYLIQNSAASNLELVRFVHENCGTDLNKQEPLQKLVFFHKLLDEDKFNIRLDSLQQAFNQLSIKESINREPEIVLEGKTITIRGFNVKTSQIHNETSSKQFQHVQVQAFNKIIFDQDLNFPHSKDDQATALSMIAPSWELIGNCQINLSGHNGEIHPTAKAQNGTNGSKGDNGKDYIDHDGKEGGDGTSGADGQPGNDGMAGGDFLAVGNRFHLGDPNYKLSVVSNGGNGSNGQYGGNGGHGGNGGAPYTDVHVFSYSNHEVLPAIIKYDTKYLDTFADDHGFFHTHRYCLVSKGGIGGHGGDAGRDGEKGYGGAKGTIQLFFPGNLANNISLQSSDGQDGLQGNGNKEQQPKAGKGGTSANLYVAEITNKATYVLMEPKEHGKEGIWSNQVNPRPSKESKTSKKISSYNEITDYLQYAMIEQLLYPQDFITSLQSQILPQKITELSNRALTLNEIFRARWNDKYYLALLPQFGEEIAQFFNKHQDNLRGDDQQLRVLNYLYANNKSLLNLVNSYNKHIIIIDIKEYLNLCVKYAEELEQMKQLNIKMECKNSYEKNLKVKIENFKDSIEGLVKDIKTYKTEIAKEFESITDELLDNKKVTEANILLYRENIAKLKSIMETKMVLDILSTCAKGAAFLGPVGAVTGTVISTAVDVGGNFIQEPNTSVLKNLSNNLNLDPTIGSLRNDLLYRQNRAQHKIEEELSKVEVSRKITKLKEKLATDIRISEESFENQKKAQDENFQKIVDSKKATDPKLGEAFADFERIHAAKEGQKKAIDVYSKLYESESLHQPSSKLIEIFEEQNKLFGNSEYRNEMISKLKYFDDVRAGYTEEQRKGIKARLAIENEETEALKKQNSWDEIGIATTKKRFKKKLEEYDNSSSSTVREAIKLQLEQSRSIKEIDTKHQNSLDEDYKKRLTELRKKYEGETTHNLDSLIASKINHEHNIQVLNTHNKENTEAHKRTAWSDQEGIEKHHQAQQIIYNEQRKADKIAKYTAHAEVTADVVKGIAEIVDKRQRYEDKIKQIEESYHLATENLDKIRDKRIETMKVQKDLMESISKNFEESLTGLGDASSRNEVVIRKLNIKNYLEQIKHFIHINYQTYKADSKLQNIFNRLENHLKSIIELSENIQNFNDQVLLANYIGDMLDTDSDANILPECLQDLKSIKLHTQYNIVRSKYLKAANAFEQWAFPFKNEYMKKYTNNQHEVLASPTESNIKELVTIVNQDINKLQEIVTESKVEILEIDGKIKMHYKFNTNKHEYPPFCTWNYDQYKYEIIRLLNLEPVVLYSDVKRAKKFVIKFAKISISIECNSTDSVISSEVNDKLRVLEDANLTLTHFGDCQYRFKDDEGQNKVIKINSPYPESERPPIEHSYDYYHDDGKHKTCNQVHAKLAGKAILSPYATWEIQLAPLVDDNRSALLANLQHIASNQDYLETIEVHLVGEGQFVEYIGMSQ